MRSKAQSPYACSRGVERGAAAAETSGTAAGCSGTDSGAANGVTDDLFSEYSVLVAADGILEKLVTTES